VGRVAASLPGCSTARCSPSRHAIPLSALPQGVGDDPALASLPDHDSLWCYHLSKCTCQIAYLLGTALSKLDELS
jgi:hypothetical protein